MFTRSDRLRPNTKFSRLSGTESDKSLIDDLYLTESCKHESKLVLRSAEGKLLSEDLYLRGQQCHAPPHNNNNTPNVYNKQNKTNKNPQNKTTPILINTKRNSTPPSLFINITNTHVIISRNTQQQQKPTTNDYLFPFLL